MDFKLMIAEALSEKAGLSAFELAGMIECPPNPQMGDFALPCFKLAKAMRKAPPVIAEELSSTQLPAFVGRSEVAGGYLNFFVDGAFYAKTVLNSALSAGAHYGSGSDGEGKVVCIDYSSINIAKPFHIGHLSTTALGHSLYRIYNFLGYKCVGINHLGDWGTQFGKLIVSFKKWGDKKTIENGGVNEMLKIYVKFHDEAEKDPSLDNEARAWFKKIEDGDPEAVALFNWFKELTLKEVSRVYDLLGVQFDSYAGESFYNDKMERVIDELKAKNLMMLDQGAWVVNFPEKDSMPPCLVLKADGATLYATRDIAAALYRKDTYDFCKSLYVVAYQQTLHFQQLFKVVEMMGYEWANTLEHVAFGMVSLTDGTLSTRRGKVVLLEDVLHKSIEKALDIINEKSPALENKEEVAKMVGVGAMLFNTLANGRIKDIVFDLGKALNFEGETGPYCQYTHARCCSLIAKAGGLPAGEVAYENLADDEALAVIKLIAAFPDTVRSACAKNEPYLITRLVVDLAQAYNKFYFEHRIIGEPADVMNARLALTEAARSVIASGLYLIGVQAPVKM